MTSNMEHATDLGEAREKEGTIKRIRQQLNFFRIHILFFVSTPLLISVIFYASNGRYKISYIDSLFNCVSAMTVCGLATVDLSSLTAFQQSLLFFQMCIGNPVVISWVMVLVRKFFFAQKFKRLLPKTAVARAKDDAAEVARHKRWPDKLAIFLSKGRIQHGTEGNQEVDSPPNLRPDMIRRLDSAPMLINPSGCVSEESSPAHEMAFLSQLSGTLSKDTAITSSTVGNPARLGVSNNTITKQRRRLSEPVQLYRPQLPYHAGLQRFETVTETPSRRISRPHIVEFAPTPDIDRDPVSELEQDLVLDQSATAEPRPVRRSSFARTHSLRTQHTHHSFQDRSSSKNRGFGGFPMPWAIIKSILARLFPAAFKRKLARTMTMPATVSITPSHGNGRPGAKQVPYITFEAIVGRNSTFHMLTSEQMDEIGGVEYRALNALLWIVPIYHFLIQLLSFVIIATYISQPRWQHVFQNEQKRPINSVWFSAFQVVSAYTNTGMSLVDQSMVPFNDAIVMIIVLIFLILAGNTAFPILLRHGIWCTTKIIRRDSRLNETLHFLLDHPRRCFMYLFPSHQTWFLLTIVLALTCIDWFSFLVLDIGIPVIDQIPLNIRVLDGLMQGVAVRAAGFAIVPLAALSPAVKVLYVVMMYISVYPIAMSVRSTNVYEEQSLGVFHEGDQDDEMTFEPSGSRLTVWSRYLAMHARRQLAFDMWWLALSLFLICIIERDNLMYPGNATWFNIFNIIFELVSAYGTVGLSLGITNQNYSLAGAMHPLSKLIICAVMLRGRHRGLPVAIDRAIMLPSELEEAEGRYLENTGRSNLGPI